MYLIKVDPRPAGSLAAAGYAIGLSLSTPTCGSGAIVYLRLRCCPHVLRCHPSFRRRGHPPHRDEHGTGIRLIRRSQLFNTPGVQSGAADMGLQHQQSLQHGRVVGRALYRKAASRRERPQPMRTEATRALCPIGHSALRLGRQANAAIQRMPQAGRARTRSRATSARTMHWPTPRAAPTEA